MGGWGQLVPNFYRSLQYGIFYHYIRLKVHFVVPNLPKFMGWVGKSRSLAQLSQIPLFFLFEGFPLENRANLTDLLYADPYEDDGAPYSSAGGP